jgi:BMFP domain-containing protein YqiC
MVILPRGAIITDLSGACQAKIEKIYKNIQRQIEKFIQTLYIVKTRNFMAVSTVNISFQEDLLEQIDRIAQNEARTRSESIREAARIYIEL